MGRVEFRLIVQVVTVLVIIKVSLECAIFVEEECDHDSICLLLP